MTIQEILAQLCEERKLLDQVITNLEVLAQGRKRGPGRPPSRFTQATQVDDNSEFLDRETETLRH